MVFVGRAALEIKMHFEKKPVKLPIANIDILVQREQKKVKSHGSLLSDSIRAVFCGPSNCGKMNALLSLI